ncbi:MAG: hypothetical protein HY308_08500 [Gammaproteobacteria bacterium]|nr:hypothetical protein [Gammaproteobacteria bacterium]
MHPDIYMALRPQLRAAVLSWFSLGASALAMFAYALPTLLDMLGFSTQATSLSSTLPLLKPSRIDKNAAFISSGALLAVATWLVWCARRPRALDPALARRCRRIRFWNRRALRASAGFWFAAVLIAYIGLSIYIGCGFYG